MEECVTYVTETLALIAAPDKSTLRVALAAVKRRGFYKFAIKDYLVFIDNARYQTLYLQ